MTRTDVIHLFVAIVICECAGAIGSVFTQPSIESGWYAALVKPPLTPPNGVFGPVWITLFALMGIAAFLVWKQGMKRPDVRAALGLFAVQLLLNVLWSVLFFGKQNPEAAFREIIFLWLAIAVTLFAFWRISKPAGLLLVPYLLWVTFAAYLTLAISVLN